MSGPDEPTRPRGADADAEGVAWDDGQWVDVGGDYRWHPSFAERSRAFVILLVLGGVLLLSAALASMDDDSGERETSTADTSSSTTTTEPSTTEATAPPDPASVDGDAPPAECVDDDRDARPLRERDDSTVLVLNGTAHADHADDHTDDLEELGYTSMQPDNADLHETTEIEYLPGHCAEAVRARVDLGVPTANVAPLEEDEASPDVVIGRAVVVITLGTDTT